MRDRGDPPGLRGRSPGGGSTGVACGVPAGRLRDPVRAQGERLKKAQALLAKAHTKDSTQALRKLTTMADGQQRIINDPRCSCLSEDVFAGVQTGAIYHEIRTVLGKYRRTPQSAGRTCWNSPRWYKWPRNVVGVGSVGYP